MHAYAKFDVEDLKVKTLSVYISGVNTLGKRVVLQKYPYGQTIEGSRGWT